MSFLLSNKWAVLFVLEVVAWSATFFMLYARYRLENKLWFKLGAVITVLTGVLPQVSLGIVNYYFLGEVDSFTVVIVTLIIYGLTLGKKHVRLLDNWMLKKYGCDSNK